MPLTYNIEEDGLYKKGLLKGEERGEKRGEKRGEERGEKRGIQMTLLVIQLLKEGKSIKEAAELTKLTEEEVRKIKESIS